MNLWESVRMAFRSLAANKLRAGLTMLGIIIGTGAVIALLSVGEGAKAAITSQIQSIGSNLVFVFPGRFEQTSGYSQNYAPLTLEDAQALADPALAPHVAAVAPIVDRSFPVTAGGDALQVEVVGSTAEFEFVRNYPVEFGAFLSEPDTASEARVVVLGAATARKLFGEEALALGETVRINRIPFTVVGVLASKGGQGFGGGTADDIAIVPITTALRRLVSGRQAATAGRVIDYISVSALDEKSIDAAIDEISWVLRDRHGIEYQEDDFTATSQQDILGVFDQITNVLTIFLGAIAGISLLVGGIGIMNIMLVSVTERTREIGIRKAVGARRGDILGQFLIESIVMSVIGGVVGIGFGWGISLAVNATDQFTTVVTPQSVLLAVSFSMAVGLFFGIYPASRAANLNPIDALHYE
ncbi:MAG: ABC transporter permease [Anaerolineae bacterium]|jgi:putative ABC transport system permease protein